jgi:hypothetical protein
MNLKLIAIALASFLALPAFAQDNGKTSITVKGTGGGGPIPVGTTAITVPSGTGPIGPKGKTPNTVKGPVVPMPDGKTSIFVPPHPTPKGSDH